MDNVPQIFISATAADLESTRGAVKLAVVDAGCLTAEQKELPYDDRQIRTALKTNIQKCDAVVALTGFVYGPEPNAKLSERRRSCAQMEHDLAIELQKPLFVFLFAYGYPFDTHNHVESDELRRLQEAHRDQVVNSGRQYVTVESEKDLQLKLREMGTFLARVKASQDQRSASARFAIRAIAAAVVIGLVLVGGGAMLAWPYVEAYLNRPVPVAAAPLPAPEAPLKSEAGAIATTGPAALPVPEPAKPVLPPAPQPAASTAVAVRTPDETRAPPVSAPAPAPAPVVSVPPPPSPPDAPKPATVVVSAPPAPAAPAPPAPPVAPSPPAPPAVSMPPATTSAAPATGAVTPPPASAKTAVPAFSADGPFTHVVEKGDTLWDIAQQYGTTIKRLQAFNKNLKPTNLKIGAEIRIPGAMEADPPSDGTAAKEEPAKSKRGKK